MPTPVKALAQQLGLRTIEPERLRDAVGVLASVGASVFAVVSYGKIVPQTVLDLPTFGALNVHPSLLPLYRGATPLRAVLRDGRTDSGVTVIAMDAGMDTGDVVLQERHDVGLHETHGELHDRFATVGARLLATAVERAADGTLERTPQSAFGVPESEIAATLTRPLRKEDLVLDWSLPAQRLADQVRSLSPQPGARADVAGAPATLKVLRARAVEAENEAAQGALVVLAGGDPAVRCGDGRLLLLERVVAPGRPQMSGAEFVR